MLRKTALALHVATSVGWLGAVAAFLAVAVAGLVTDDAQTARGAYAAAAVVTWAVIVPLCLAALATGVVQSLGTPWGLFRHHWVVVKLALTAGATVLLLVHTQPIDALAAVPESGVLAADLRGTRVQLVVDAALALVVLLVTTVLGVVKPRGVTRHGRRRAARGGRLPTAGARTQPVR